MIFYENICVSLSCYHSIYVWIESGERVRSRTIWFNGPTLYQRFTGVFPPVVRTPSAYSPALPEFPCFFVSLSRDDFRFMSHHSPVFVPWNWSSSVEGYPRLWIKGMHVFCAIIYFGAHISFDTFQTINSGFKCHFELCRLRADDKSTHWAQWDALRTKSRRVQGFAIWPAERRRDRILSQTFGIYTVHNQWPGTQAAGRRIQIYISRPRSYSQTCAISRRTRINLETNNQICVRKKSTCAYPIYWTLLRP